MVPATLRNPSGGRRRRGVECQTRGMRGLVIHVPNEPGALAQVAAGVSDAGVNLAAATHIGSEPTADLHILVKHPEATRRVLERAGITVGEDGGAAVGE